MNLEKAILTNPRWATADDSQPNGEGAPVGPWVGFDNSNAIDGVYDFDGADHGAHPAGRATFFVDLIESSLIHTVKVWPRLAGGGKFYEGMEVYAGSVLCNSKEPYTTDYVDTTIIPNQEPMIFLCPSGTSASTLKVTPGTVNDGWLHLAEIEAFIENTMILDNMTEFTPTEGTTSAIVDIDGPFTTTSALIDGGWTYYPPSGPYPPMDESGKIFVRNSLEKLKLVANGTEENSPVVIKEDLVLEIDQNNESYLHT